MSKYNALVQKLREIFQIDQPDLDFGIYRVINQRADLIRDYLENHLKAKVESALADGNAAGRDELDKELKAARKNAEDLGMDPDTVPKVRELQARYKTLSGDVSEHENAVFTHLLTFFSRYYEDGDFISQRRYKGDTYAIPYAGEEVVLHWANKDQYYTKSGESFSNYSFKLSDGRRVQFRLVSADTAKDNRKDNSQERRFRLIDEQTRLRQDDDGETWEETLHPVAEEDGALVLRFEYAPQPKGTKQADLNQEVLRRILAQSAISARWAQLATREPTPANPGRTLLEKHLERYTAKNSADYFIHKDLKDFLSRELDFYIKNEVLHLDDLEAAGRFAEIEKNLRMIQCLRAIARDLIDFLAQIENFQKKLWLKKKFVTEAHYCLSLDRIPEALYPEIAANEAQREVWVKLYAIDEIKATDTNGDQKAQGEDLFETGPVAYSAPLSVAFLKANPHLMLDTALFPPDFKARLLKSIENLDELCDGLLVHSENFQALNLLQDRYHDAIKCAYFDPPYNTGDDGFVYKDSYQSSSWSSMMNQVVQRLYCFLGEEGSLFANCDENEFLNFGKILQSVFDKKNHVETITWNKRVPKNDKSIGNIHEYIYLFAKNHMARRLNERGFVMRKDALEDIYDIVKKEKSKGSDLLTAQSALKRFYKKQGFDRGLTLYCELDPNFEIFGKINMSWPNAKSEGPRYKVINPATGKPAPIPDRGWRWKEETFRKAELDGPTFELPDGSVIKGKIWYSPNENIQPSSITYLKEVESFLLRSIISLKSDGSIQLENLGLGGLLDYPKPVKLSEWIFYSTEEKSGCFLDCFAGSGTTGHAVINLNREDGGKRKYILVEMGDHFDTVMKPRLQKVAYAAEWKDGKPTARDTGISHGFKYLRLESYEDTLNNLALERKGGDLFENAALAEDYLLRYLLDVESEGSLLSLERFARPFDVTLDIAVDSAGATERRPVDLVETFNYLLGLRVEQIDADLARGFTLVKGRLPGGEKTLILWRDCEKVGYGELDKLCQRYNLNPRDSEYDVIYINGDHNIPTLMQESEKEGGLTRELKIRQIEPEFLDRMFRVEDV